MSICQTLWFPSKLNQGLEAPELIRCEKKQIKEKQIKDNAQRSHIIPHQCIKAHIYVH